ncbi:DMT family transporter [Rubrimonas cliftonensis]|uniref:EamA-like transporter family protein n=1 Tax=Rubrimonas cliftonensis TaxID=89524 RepID=A0A1H3Y9L2_9RHOB|nr:DMT family transporter [Rubrimonas cliftonensis]SEA08357.1 EamA-like transporter family protein [Rubrimonas cliftonensis]
MTVAADGHPTARPMAAAGWMGLAIVSFAAMAVAGRELSAHYDTFEIMFYRSAIGLPIVAALLLRLHGWRGAATAQPWGHVRRNVIHFTGQNLWFYGVATIPLAQLVALEFTNPIWVAMLAPLLLGETLTRWKLVAALLGFAGVLVIAQPGVAPLELGHLAALASALGFALTNIFTRGLMRRDGALCVLFWMTLSQMLMGLACALPGGVAGVTPETLPWVLFVGVCGLSAHMGLTRALGFAPASVVAPMEFLRLPVIAVVGLTLYGEPVELALALGAALILLGNVLNLRAQRRGA